MIRYILSMVSSKTSQLRKENIRFISFMYHIAVFLRSHMIGESRKNMDNIIDELEEQQKRKRGKDDWRFSEF